MAMNSNRYLDRALHVRHQGVYAYRTRATFRIREVNQIQASRLACDGQLLEVRRIRLRRVGDAEADPQAGILGSFDRLNGPTFRFLAHLRDRRTRPTHRLKSPVG